MACVQTLSPGREQPRIDAALERLSAERVVARLWQKDASLWSDDPKIQASIRSRLGWLAAPKMMAGRMDDVARIAADIRAAGFTHALLLGMGGSSLFSEVCRHTFGVATGWLDLAILDSTDPSAIRAAQARAPLKKTLAIISSKSGATSEVSALSKYFYEAFRRETGDPGAHCLAITDAGTPLDALAREQKFRHVFTHGPDTGADVGGRFSAFVGFGFLPAALLGVDVQVLRVRMEEGLNRCGADVPVRENPAAVLGAVLGELYAHGRDKMTLFCSKPLESFGAWVEQLVAESTGKLGKGIAPITGEPPREPSQYGNDRVFVELQLASELDAKLDQQVRAIAASGQPVLRIHLDDRDELGGEVAKWAIATAIAASFMRLNPFDEPNVQESKDRTKALLAEYTRTKRLPDEAATVTEGQLAAFGALNGRPASVADALAAWLQQQRPGDYVALLSFLPRTPALDAAVADLRKRLACLPAAAFATGQAGVANAATMLGIGPRYLHSTGQLYKGGPDAALFLLLTSDEPADLPIPGEQFSFAVLKHAQALGDAQAMAQKGRRLLRIHLRGNLDRAAQQLVSALESATAAVLKR